MNQSYKTILFYKFFKVAQPEEVVQEQKALCQKLGLLGRMLVANEGINATFEGTVEQIEQYKKALSEDARYSDIVFKESKSDGKAFTSLKIKVRKEVVTLGAGEFEIDKETAPAITADELALLYQKNEDFVVLDLRNDYEVQVGYFDKTVNPELQNFRDLPEKLKELEPLKNKKVVAVCTGGIRCEKATCLLRREGFDNLYQLKDGIHTYMQKYPGQNFKGTLFVFDNRMTTPVEEGAKREIVGRCINCGIACEEIWSDDSLRPSRKVVCCSVCAHQMPNLRSTAYPHQNVQV